MFKIVPFLSLSSSYIINIIIYFISFREWRWRCWGGIEKILSHVLHGLDWKTCFTRNSCSSHKLGKENTSSTYSSIHLIHPSFRPYLPLPPSIHPFAHPSICDCNYLVILINLFIPIFQVLGEYSYAVPDLEPDSVIDKLCCLLDRNYSGQYCISMTLDKNNNKIMLLASLASLPSLLSLLFTFVIPASTPKSFALPRSLP